MAALIKPPAGLLIDSEDVFPKGDGALRQNADGGTCLSVTTYAGENLTGDARSSLEARSAGWGSTDTRLSACHL